MNVRRLASAVLASVLLLAFGAAAQKPSGMPRVGILGPDSKTLAPHTAGFLERMRALGYEDGRNVIVEYRWAEGQFDRLPALAAELVAQNPDVIVAISPPATRAAQRATTTVPVVFMAREPVAMGFAPSLARPGGNMTGVAFQDTELSTKRLDILRHVVPNLTRVAVVWNKEGAGADAVRALETATKPMGVELLALEIREAADIPGVIASAKSAKVHGIVQLPSVFMFKNRSVLLEAVAREKLPMMCEERVYVVEGCLMSYSANYVAMVRRLADYVDRILRGAKAGDLPIEQPREFDFVINQRTAQALGLSVPNTLIVQATEVIR